MNTFLTNSFCLTLYYQFISYNQTKNTIIIKHNTKGEIMNNFLKSKIGYGTYKVTDQNDLYNSINWAALAKYDFIDTAAFYKNETQIGKAIKLFKKEFPKKKYHQFKRKYFLIILKRI